MENELGNETTGVRIITEAVCDILKTNNNLSECGIAVVASNDWSKDKEKIEISKDAADYFSDLMDYLYAKNGVYVITQQDILNAEDHILADGIFERLMEMKEEYKGKRINILEVRAWYNPDRIGNVVRMIFHTTAN